MSGNLEAQYLAVRGQDPEEAAYQQSLAKAREEDSHEGILASLGHTVGEAASSLRDPERTGKNALVALFDMVKNTAQMGADVWTAATNLDNKRTAKDMGVQGEVKPVPEIRLEDLAPDFMQKANALRDEAAFGSTGGDVFTQKSLQFAIPFMGSMKLLGAGAEVGAMANLGKAVVADAAVSFSVWDPHEGRFADLLNTVYPNAAVIGPAIDFLASDPNDSAMEGRFKNALDSQLAGAAFSSFAFVAGKTLRAAKSGELFKPGPPAGSPGAQRGMISFHGSQHNFDQFALNDKTIGTGEGVQAYGHGLYFAESPTVAKQYQKQLAGDVFEVADGKIFDPSSLKHLNVRNAVRKGDLAAAIKKAKDIAESGSPVASAAKSDLEVLSKLQARGGIKPAKGKLYTVDIPDEQVGKMLDWDKPLKDQDPTVRAAFEKVLEKDGWGNFLKAVKAADAGDKNALKNAGYGPFDYPGAAGGIYETVASEVGAKKLSEMMRDAGIPGIKYFDAGSRTAGDGTRNIVLFDPKHAKIVKKE